MKYWWIWYRTRNTMKQTCVAARDPETARKVAEAWQRDEEDNNRQVALIPRPDQARIEPFCVADETILEKKDVNGGNGNFIGIDYSKLTQAKVIDALTMGFLNPEAVYAMEIDGDQRKGILTHLRDKYSQPPLPEAIEEAVV